MSTEPSAEGQVQTEDQRMDSSFTRNGSKCTHPETLGHLYTVHLTVVTRS
jgi:hypothetical protein